MDTYQLNVIRLAGAGSLGVRWCLDKPDTALAYSAQQLQQGIVLSGWVVSAQPAVTMFIRQGDQQHCFCADQARPDVVKRLLANSAAPQLFACGFNFTLSCQADVVELGMLLAGEPLVLARLEVAGKIQVLKGREDWLFLDNDNNKSVEQYTGKRLLGWLERLKWKRYCKGLQRAAATLQVPYALLVAPSKESVYSQYYPYVRGKKTVIEQLRAITPADFNLLYPISQLQQSPQRTYKLTDTHWSTHGARIATECLALSLGIAPELVDSVFARDYYYHADVVGDLGNKVFPPASAKEAFIDNYHYLKKRIYDNGLPNFGRIQVFANDTAIHSGHCLVFGSSSSYAMLSYLTRVFTRLTLIHSAGNIDQALAQRLQPDFLVAQTNERFAVRSPAVDYHTADSIADKLNALSTEQWQSKAGELAQKYDVAADATLTLLHSLYQQRRSG